MVGALLTDFYSLKQMAETVGADSLLVMCKGESFETGSLIVPPLYQYRSDAASLKSIIGDLFINIRMDG